MDTQGVSPSGWATFWAVIVALLIAYSKTLDNDKNDKPKK